MKYEVITKDCFNIASRIKQIDANYIVKWNKTKKRYELFYKQFGKEHLEIVFPYKQLDYRSIKHILKTRIQNYKKLIEDIQRKNDALEKKQKEKARDIASLQAKELTKYVFSKGDSQSVKLDNAYKTKWV